MESVCLCILHSLTMSSVSRTALFGLWVDELVIHRPLPTSEVRDSDRTNDVDVLVQ